MVENLEKKELWDEYGINPDIVVSEFSPLQQCAISTDHNLQPFTHDFPHADIHELISCDLLHQVIKGTFKDHLVTWVGEYLDGVHGKSKAAKIMADIDRRYMTELIQRLILTQLTGFLLFLLTQGSAGSSREGASTSGLGTTRRHL